MKKFTWNGLKMKGGTTSGEKLVQSWERDGEGEVRREEERNTDKMRETLQKNEMKRVEEIHSD